MNKIFGSNLYFAWNKVIFLTLFVIINACINNYKQIINICNNNAIFELIFLLWKVIWYFILNKVYLFLLS